MKKQRFLFSLLMAIVMQVGMLVPQGAWAITFFTEEDDDFWCEDNMSKALNYLSEIREMGYHVTTMRFDSDIALDEELDLSRLGQDITIDLHGCVLTNINEPWALAEMSCIVYFRDCDYRITIQDGTIESNELDAIYYNGISPVPNYQLVLKGVKVVTHQEGRHCLFDAMPEDHWEDYWGYENPESSPKLQIINSQFHSNGCSAISFTRQRNDERVKSILPGGHSFYNANTDVELVEYADRPFVDENGNPATDIRTGRSPDLPKMIINDCEESNGSFKQAMDAGWGEKTLMLLDDVKEGLCTTNRFKSVTIDLNGHTLDITRLSTYGGEYLNIIDNSEGKTGKLIVERFDVYTPAENNAVIEGEVTTWGNNRFTNNGLVEYVDGGFINNGDFITSWTWADDHSSATLRINHEDVDAVVTNEDTTPATCIASGVRTYTAAATYRDRNYADTRDEEIAALGHNFTSQTLTAESDEHGLYAFVCDNGCGEHNDAHVIKDFNGEGNHLALTTDGEGHYSTTANIEIVDATAYVSPVEFTAPSIEYTRTFGGTNWTTWYAPFDLELTDEICQKLAFSRINNVHQYDDDNNGVPDRTEIESFRQKAGVTLKANYPYLVKVLDDAYRNLELHLSDVRMAAAAENSIDCQSVDYLYTFTGTYTGKSNNSDAFDAPYSLFDDVADNNWYHFHNLEPQRHYMVIEPTNGGQAPRNIKVRLNVVGEEDATGIVTIYSNKEKMQGETYDLMGRKLNSNSPQRGLRIQNGKVIFNK